MGKPDKKALGIYKAGPPSYLDVTFPLWTDAAALPDKDEKEKYSDPFGTKLPLETESYLDTWKRPEELVMQTPNVPMVLFRPAPSDAGPPRADIKDIRGAKQLVLNRDLEGKMFSGHSTFEWMQATFASIISAQKSIKPGDYLWELIYPKDKEGHPCKSPCGKYKVKLFIMDAWRVVTVDDRIPVDLFGRALPVGVRPLQLWPLLLCKAVLKVMVAHRLLDMALPHQVAVFQLLTGWPQEDLLDPLSGTRLVGGFLFDRLGEAVQGQENRWSRKHIANTTLITRALPERLPPRIIVLAGPSAVGRGPLVRRLLAQFPDKLGRTVSSTTRRPKAHEVHDTQYSFLDKAGFQAGVREGQFLEHAQVAGPGGTYHYGTTFSTVREVAATGKLCVMALDVQGAKQLQANKRIDGLYIYVSPPSLAALEERQRGRLREAESTIAQRMAWAEQQVARSASPGLYDAVVENVGFDAVYLAVKEAISTLSPIIRNRLRGLPAYVLDYADLIPPNMVEKPFLKPVILAGPSVGERRELMELLVQEFPDVFAFPRLYTTRPHKEDDLYRVVPADGSPSAVEPLVDERHPQPVSLSAADFEAAAAGCRFLQSHVELFKHSLAAHKYGVAMEDMREVIKSGRLPLLELESEGAAAFKEGGIDCLTIFLRPSSLQDFRERLSRWLTEDDQAIAARRAVAEAEIEGASAPGSVFDHVLVNDQLEDAYAELVGVIAAARPDITATAAEGGGPIGEPEPVPPAQPILVVVGPPGAGRERLVEALLETYPDKLAAPPVTTDRKPAKGEESSDTVKFITAKEMSRAVTDLMVAYSWPGETVKETWAVMQQAITQITITEKVALLDLPNAGLTKTILGNGYKSALFVFVASPGIAAFEGYDPEEVEAAAIEAEASGLYAAVLRAADETLLLADARAALSQHVPLVMPPLQRPLVVAGPFGTGKRVLLQRLFEAYPGRFAVPVITTTKRTSASDHDDRQEMQVVSKEAAAAELAAGGFLVHSEVLGELYGITATAVKQVQATGRVAVVEVDEVAHALKLRGSGFPAAFIFIGMEDEKVLLETVKKEILRNPPLGYEPEEAACLFYATALAENTASRTATVAPHAPASSTSSAPTAGPEAPGTPLFDSWVADEPGDAAASLARLAEAVSAHYPDVVPICSVWGYGRPLWDRATRVHGRKPLRVMLLGPAAVGKTTQSALLSARFGVPHVNVGDLLYDEVARKTELGLAAKVFMDASQTVPGELLMQLLLQRLAQPDCVTLGWVVDAFPHTQQQAVELAQHGVVPDKVVFMDGEHAVLQDRAKFRRVDYLTGKIYHVPGNAAALSPPILPTDADVLPRLQPRHDDSEENVANRLALWDQLCEGLRAAFEDVSLRVAGGQPVAASTSQISDFITLESRMPDLDVVPSTSLKELQYEVVNTLRYKRRQLLKLQQPDRLMFWVDLNEMGPNSHCLLLHHDPTQLVNSCQLRRIDVTACHRSALLYVDSPEPIHILCCLFSSMQAALQEVPPAQQRVLLVNGPAGVGKSALLALLTAEFGSKLARVPATTSRLPAKGEAEGVDFCFVGDDQMEMMEVEGTLACGAAAQQGGASYGVARSALEAAWGKGLLPVVEGPVALAAALREGGELQVTCVYLTTDVDTLDQRLRRQDKLPEADLLNCLRSATDEMMAVASGSILTDLTIVNTKLLDSYAQLKEAASKLWHPRAAQLPGQLFIEEFKWTSSKPGASRCRLRTHMSNSSRLALPRGRHLLRVQAADKVLHAATFLSSTPFQAAEYSKVLPLYDPQLFVQQIDGEQVALGPAASTLLFRYNLQLGQADDGRIQASDEDAGPTGSARSSTTADTPPAPHILSVTLSISSESLRSATQLMLIDNDTRAVSVHPSGRTGPLPLPQNQKGYCLLAVVEAGPGGTREGTWSLTLTATVTPMEFVVTPVARTQVLEGIYQANVRGIISRHLVTATMPLQMAVSAATSPALPFRLLISPLLADQPQWPGDYPAVYEAPAPGGQSSLANTVLPVGRYLVQTVLNGAACPLGWQPDPATGTLLAGPLAYRVVLMPAGDDRAVIIAPDESRARYFKAMVDGWNAAPVAIAIPKGPASGAAAAAKPMAGKAGLRSAAASAVLDRHIAGIAATAAALPVLRTLKDGTIMTLAPEEHLRRGKMTKSGMAEPLLLAEEQLDERRAGIEAAAATMGPAALTQLASTRDLARVARTNLVARQAAQLAEIRGKRLNSQQSAAMRRAELIQTHKQVASITATS